MSVANPLWGAPRIHGELLKLGIDVGQTSVAKYMVRRRVPLSLSETSSGWRLTASLQHRLPCPPPASQSSNPHPAMAFSAPWLQSHGARIHTCRSSSVVKITGMALA